MPLFEYRCQSCRKDFDLLVLPGRDVAKACPACGSTALTQKISVFAAHSGSASSGAGDFSAGSAEEGSCGRCGGTPGSCARED